MRTLEGAILCQIKQCAVTCALNEAKSVRLDPGTIVGHTKSAFGPYSAVLVRYLNSEVVIVLQNGAEILWNTDGLLSIQRTLNLVSEFDIEFKKQLKTLRGSRPLLIPPNAVITYQSSAYVH